MKYSLILAGLLSLAVARPQFDVPVVENGCLCNYICFLSAGTDCACEIEQKNICFQNRLDKGLTDCAPLVLSESCSTVLGVGEEGDECDPESPCGIGLRCIPKKAQASDLGGTCQPITKSTP